MEPENHASDESVSSGPSLDFHFNFDAIQNNHEITSANSSNNLPELGTTNQLQRSQQILTPRPSSIAVGLGLGPRVQYGAVHSEQDSHQYHPIYPNTHPNNSGLANFSQLGALSLSLNMGSPNPDRSHINITHNPLFFDLNWHAARPTLNTRRLQAHYHYHNPMPFRHLRYHIDGQQHYSGQPILCSTMPRSRKNYENDHDMRARDGALMHCIVRESSRPSICIKGGIGNGRMKDQSTHGWPLIAMEKNSSDARVTNSVYDIIFEEVGQPIDPHLRLFVPL